MNQTNESELKELNESDTISNSSLDDYFQNITPEDISITEMESNLIDISFDNCDFILNDENLSQNEQIICIELMNNNRLYVNYESNWTLRDLLNAILKKKEFLQLYNLRDYMNNYKFMNTVFDFKLIIYRASKEKDEKVDLNIRIKDLENLGFLKHPRFPFLYLIDSRNFNYISQNKKFLKTVYENSVKNNNYKVFIHQDLIYRDYLPRSYISYISSNNSKDVTELYSLSKKCFNNFNKIYLDPLIGDSSTSNNLDWFIYDDESLNFLIKMENTEFKVDKNIKIINNKIFFQDKLPFMTLSNKEFKHIFININLNKEIKMKIDVNLSTSVIEILKKVNNKLKLSHPDLTFDPDIKILKVHSLSDYIIDIEEPIGLFNYFTQCIRNNTTAEYVIIDSPYFIQDNRVLDFLSNNDKSQAYKKRRSSSLNELVKFQNTNNFLVDNKKQQVKKQASVMPNPFSKPSDNNKFTSVNKTFKPSETDTKILRNPNNIQLSDTNVLKNYEKNPKTLVLPSSENLYFKNHNKNKFDNIAVFNENIVEFSEMKGIRKRIALETQKTYYSFNDEVEFTFIDKMIQKSIEEKLLLENEKIKNSSKYKLIKIDVDQLIKDHPRSRSKGIRENSRDKKRSESRNKILKENKGRNSNEEKNAKNKSTNATNSNLKYDDLISEMNRNINIRNLIRPFIVKINLLKLNQNFLKSVYSQKNSLNKIDNLNFNNIRQTSLELVLGIFIGNESISNKVEIPLKGPVEVFSNMNLNNFLEFNLKYCDLPLFSNLIIKLKTQIKIKSEYKKKTIAWVNFRLFDHLKRLKTGKHKISFWDTNFSEDSYFSSIDNHKSNTGDLYFQLESFMRAVEFEMERDIDENEILLLDEEVDYHMKNRPRETKTSILQSDDIVIEKISLNNPFEELTEDEKEILWRNRYSAIYNPNLICKLFKSVNKRDFNHMKELEKLTLICKYVNPIQALELLNGSFLNESIRNFAVESLKQVSSLEIGNYILQLVQSLKYEVYHDSSLARFLLKLGINYPLTIGHSLFWNLKSEMHNTNVKQRFGLYLEVFISKLGSEIRRVFEDEVLLVNSLIKVCDIAFPSNNKKTITNDVIKTKMEEELEKINEEYFKDREISIPYNYKIKVNQILSKKCKFMKSKKKPLWLVFGNSCNLGEDVYVMFKKGDDLRQDIITLQLFKIMNNLWYEEGLNLKMSNYEVISTSHFQGMLQIVTNSETLATIQKEYGGLLSGFSNKPLKHWMCKIITNITEKEYVNNFILSSAAYCIATFVLGIGDRHNDNIMVKKNGELFHIDFGHILGHFKYKYGIKRERAPFVFTSEFCNVMGGEKSENFEIFKALCVNAYNVIRKNANVLITVLKSMLCSGVPELTQNSIKFLNYSLALKNNNKEAEEFLLIKLKDSLNSFSTKLNFAIHIMANK